MSAPSNFTYHREGNGKVLDFPNLTRRQAYELVGRSLHDNGLASKADAQRFAATVELGKPAVFEPYTFTITRVRVERVHVDTLPPVS